MDAKYGDWVITPRRGKPVELSALWFNALHCMATFARRLGEPAQEYLDAAAQTQAGFARFWHAELGYCYDVLDGPVGADPSLRPNQIFAVALPFSPLAAEQQRAVVDICARRLLTPVGLRSLDPAHRDYAATYAGSLLKRDLAYHQGTVWAWLLGPFISAHLRVYGDRDLAFSYLRPLLDQLAAAGLGSLSEVFDGDAPYAPDGCPAQAWSVAEALRALYNVS
jgi:predicted glycogen debranching enzyme